MKFWKMQEKKQGYFSQGIDDWKRDDLRFRSGYGESAYRESAYRTESNSWKIRGRNIAYGKVNTDSLFEN